MSRAAAFWEAWALALLALIVGAFLALYVPSSPVSRPGDGGVPAVTETAGTAKP